ncbi:hypothetical protein [Okeania sp. SIO2B3]|uniref:hypothetical protein n=1 Tax=Okeania sp. SIO2B3 TaxID=2607784 RepID=UPI0013BFF883|nr:hypothetical protein [Okeania sp. SIO2B3]NET45371.1 hypothetical protein [Okeania sp. SIO2B3]
MIFLKYILIVPIIISDLIVFKIPGAVLIEICERLELYKELNYILDILEWSNTKFRDLILWLLEIDKELEDIEKTIKLVEIIGASTIIIIFAITIYEIAKKVL